ncbi:MAG: TatD family hydrolase [Spirochaetes bacterium]|nr:TatD family hydrolase [Spirochaetota bacterium]MBU1078896.1 TatD family hydrolase [Spirochaetota bacterium]
MASVAGADPELGLCDTHAHLSYVEEREGAARIQEITEAYAGGSAIILDPGVDFDDFPARKAAFGSLPFVRLAAGIWPDSASMKAAPERAFTLEEYVRDPACVAVGECGLDYHWMNGTREEQERLFRAQAELAVKYSKPLIVHSRNAHDETLSIVAAYASKVPVIIHCFGYGRDEAEAYLSAGCWISFAGNVTYKKSADLMAACAMVPAGRLLLETDSPYMCPEPRRGRNSTPLDIGRTYAAVAALRGSTVQALSESVAAASRALFG